MLLSSFFFWLISFLLFPCSSVWEITRVWVPNFIFPYWMVLAFFYEIRWSFIRSTVHLLENNYGNNNHNNVLIYYYFLPPSIRGGHGKSDYAHIIIHQTALSLYARHLHLDFQQLCPFYSLPQLHCVMASHCSPGDFPPEHGRVVRKNACSSKNYHIKLNHLHMNQSSQLLPILNAQLCGLHYGQSAA